MSTRAVDKNLSLNKARACDDLAMAPGHQKHTRFLGTYLTAAGKIVPNSKDEVGTLKLGAVMGGARLNCAEHGRLRLQ